MIAKDPADRFQTGLDLVEEIEGRPAAPRRISGASTRERLAAMPTTPIPAVTADATGTRPARTSGPGRPAMQRSAAQRDLGQRKSPLGWILLLVLLARGWCVRGGEARLRTDGQAGAEDSDSTPAPVPAGARSGGLDAQTAPVADSTNGRFRTAAAAAQLASRPPAAPPPRVPASAPPAAASRAPGLPADLWGCRGARLSWWTTRRPTRRPITLIAGPARRGHFGAAACLLCGHRQHPVGAGADLYAGPDAGRGAAPAPARGPPRGWAPVDTTVINCDRPGPGYNKDQVCWDTRAAPVAPPRVTVPATMTAAAEPGQPGGQGQSRRHHGRGGHAAAVGQRRNSTTWPTGMP